MTVELTRAADLPAPASSRLDLRAELELQRRFRVAQIDDLAVDVAMLRIDGDDARVQLAQALSRAAEWALAQIDVALVRFEEGTYGLCERCHEPIPTERLEVLPTCRSCTSCQASAESADRHSSRQSA